MKNIIVPTDFSETAFNAAKYACELALINGHKIQLFHCYTSKTSIFDEEMNEKENFNSLMRGDTLMKEWKSRLETEFPNLEINTSCQDGLITDLLPKIAKEPEYSLLAIGSNDHADENTPLFGSTTSQIATESHIPVIAIPFNIQHIELNKVAILTNFKDDELESLRDYTQLLNPPKELDIIHVYQNSDDINQVEQNIKNWADRVRSIIPNASVSTILKPIDYSKEDKDTIPEIVNITINENHYDIVIVTKTRKSFFDKWFARSISKEVISKLKTTIFFDNN